MSEQKGLENEKNSLKIELASVQESMRNDEEAILKLTEEKVDLLCFLCHDVVQKDLVSKLLSCEDDIRKYVDELEQMKVRHPTSYFSLTSLTSLLVVLLSCCWS